MGIKIGWIWGRAEQGVLKTPIVEDVPRRNDRRPRFPAWNRRDDTHMSHARPTTWIMWTTQLHCRLWNKPRSGHHVNACSGGNCTVRAIASVDIISLAPITSPCTSSSYWYSQKVPYRAHMWLCGATASIVESYTCVWGSHNLQSLAHLKGSYQWIFIVDFGRFNQLSGFMESGLIGSGLVRIFVQTCSAW